MTCRRGSALSSTRWVLSSKWEVLRFAQSFQSFHSFVLLSFCPFVLSSFPSDLRAAPKGPNRPHARHASCRHRALQQGLWKNRFPSLHHITSSHHISFAVLTTIQVSEIDLSTPHSKLTVIQKTRFSMLNEDLTSLMGHGTMREIKAVIMTGLEVHLFIHPIPSFDHCDPSSAQSDTEMTRKRHTSASSRRHWIFLKEDMKFTSLQTVLNSPSFLLFSSLSFNTKEKATTERRILETGTSSQNAYDREIAFEVCLSSLHVFISCWIKAKN